MSVDSLATVKIIERVNEVQKTLKDTSGNIYDPYYSNGVIRIDFVNGIIHITNNGADPESFFGYRFPFNNTIFNYDSYTGVDKFCDAARVYFYYYSTDDGVWVNLD